MTGPKVTLNTQLSHEPHSLNRIRIATWNLEQPRLNGYVRNPRLLDRMAAIDADIWILTETSSAISPGSEYTEIASAPAKRLSRPGTNWTSIWSRFPMDAIATSQSEWAVAANVNTPAGALVVYGTVLPYAHEDCTKESGIALWQRWREALAIQSRDWMRLQSDVSAPLIVAGDLNVTLDGVSARRYGGRREVEDFNKALADANLCCTTGFDMVAAGMLESRSTVDHICISNDWSDRITLVSAWEARHDGHRLSDHNGVFIDLSEPSAS